MAIKNRSDLTTQANVIKNETVARRNTALRVGTMNNDEIDSFLNKIDDALVNGSGTTINGRSVDLGGTANKAIIIKGTNSLVFMIGGTGSPAEAFDQFQVFAKNFLKLQVDNNAAFIDLDPDGISGSFAAARIFSTHTIQLDADTHLDIRSPETTCTGDLLADKLAANVANQLNNLDIGGGAAIGSGVGGIITAPLDGLLVEGIFGLGLNNPTTQFEIQQLVDSKAILIHGFDDRSTDTIGIAINQNGAPVITGTQAIFFTPGISLFDNANFRFGGGNPNVKQRYNSTSDNFEIEHTNDVGSIFPIIDIPLNSDTFSIYKKLGINNDTPLAQVDVNQSDNAAAIPALKLTQADLSEEMIKFDPTTIGIGNPIEAIGAKSFTQTHFLKINVEGLGVKYMPIGDLA